MLKIEHKLVKPKQTAKSTVKWKSSDAVIRQGDTIIHQLAAVQSPVNWSQTAVNIVSSKYFTKGRHVEYSVWSLVSRIINTIGDWGTKQGYFCKQNGEIFKKELAVIMLKQMACFNSPVLFNVGLDSYGLPGRVDNYVWNQNASKPESCTNTHAHPQVSACFIQSVDDTMVSIMELASTHAALFKGGSGTGTNFSTLRASMESLSGGGIPSGPLSFMKIMDSTAGVVKSGGKTRRAAAMRILDVNHGDIMEFINCKYEVEKMAHDLISQGHDPIEVYANLPFQNGNHSIMISDAFVQALINNEMWQTRPVTGTTNKMPEYKASEIWDAIAKRAWECGDPGVMFEDNINKWNTCADTTHINGSNPCLARGTRLLTDKGWVKVEDLSPTGEKTDANIYDGVTYTKGTVWKTGHKALVRLETSGGKSIDVTPDHRIYTTEGWVEAKDCLNMVVPNLGCEKPTNQSLQLSKGITGGSGKAYAYTSQKLMETFGFLFGDGYLRSDINVLTVYHTPGKDSEFVNTVVVPTLSDIAASKGEVYQPGKVKNSTGITFCREKLVTWLKTLGFTSNKLPVRTLPEFIFNSSSKSIGSFLRGLFGANGNVLTTSRKAVVLVSSCKQLLKEVQLLLQTQDILSHVYTHNKEQTVEFANGTYLVRESYHLTIDSQASIYTFAKLIGFPQKCQREKLDSIVSIDLLPSTVGIKTQTDTIKSVTPIEADDVYDFSCPTTNMGLANGLVVHNCGEFIFVDDSACNLASINLCSFLNEDGSMDFEMFDHVVRIMIIAQDIMVDMASYPTKDICENSHKYRPLGLGYTNLGALLMQSCCAYDSDDGRTMCGYLTARLQKVAIETSTELAKNLGAFPEYKNNKDSLNRVMEQHSEAYCELSGSLEDLLLPDIDFPSVREGVQEHGLRNAHLTVLAPTGTISFLMDCDTFGIEPALALVTTKQLVGGGTIKQVSKSVKPTLLGMGYGEDHAANLVRELEDTGVLELRSKYNNKVFETALGDNCISWEGHVRMVAAAQPFLSGGISKTINISKDATVEDIKSVFTLAHELNLKGVTVYRDGSKGCQPISDGTKTKESIIMPEAPVSKNPRERLPDTRDSITHKFTIDTYKGYFTVGLYPDGRPGEIFISVSKEGSTIGGLLDSLGIAVSMGLQYGIPLKAYTDKFTHARFEPLGFTKNPEIRMAKSIVDYIFRWMDLRFNKKEADNNENIDVYEGVIDQEPRMDAPVCPNCGSMTTLVGACHLCSNCGTSGGCS